MGPALRSCSQFDLLIMDCSQSLYNQLGAGFPLQKRASAFSPKHSHAHVQPHKSCPPLCNGRAIIVCPVQLHLEWQRPRARGRIKDCVQSNTPFASCQRGFAALPFPSRSSVRMSGRKKTKKPQHLFPHVLHKDPLWFLICSTLLLLSVPALISLQPIGPARHCPGKLFSTPASIGQSWSSLVCWWGRVEASLLWKLSQGHGIIFIQAVLFLANTHLPQQRKKHICVHISASGRLRVSAHWIRL